MLVKQAPFAFFGLSPFSSPMDSQSPCYQLVYVDAIRPKRAAHLESEVITYFRKISPLLDVALAPLIQQPVPIQAAALLVPGSSWSAKGKLISDGTNYYPSQRTLLLGDQEPLLFQLSELFPSTDKQPDFLSELPRDSWYAVLEAEHERILIPCFELLRAFCYQAIGGLSNFLLSRMPLDTLCWPLAFPAEENDFTAHFCVASARPRFSEARVLAELLFNSDYRNTILLTHANLASDWHKLRDARQHPVAYPKVKFRLGKSVKTKAHGQHFTIKNKSYFWVSRLIPSNEWHSFKRVIYHPLYSVSSAKHQESPFLTEAQPAFCDILKGQRVKVPLSLSAELPKDFQYFGHNSQHSPLSYSEVPFVHRSFPWAGRITKNTSPNFANATVLENLWSRPGCVPTVMEGALPANKFFRQVVDYFNLFQCAPQVLEVNNPGCCFGPGNSIFPYVCAPNSQTHLPDGRYRPLSIAHIQWGKGHFYILNILEESRIILGYRKDFGKWAPDEYNKFLIFTIANYFTRFQTVIRYASFSSDYTISWQRGDDAEEAACLCHAEIKKIISKHNRELDFKKDIGLPLATNPNFDFIIEYNKFLKKQKKYALSRRFARGIANSHKIKTS